MRACARVCFLVKVSEDFFLYLFKASVFPRVFREPWRSARSTSVSLTQVIYDVFNPLPFFFPLLPPTPASCFVQVCVCLCVWFIPAVALAITVSHSVLPAFWGDNGLQCSNLLIPGAVEGLSRGDLVGLEAWPNARGAWFLRVPAIMSIDRTVRHLSQLSWSRRSIYEGSPFSSRRSTTARAPNRGLVLARCSQDAVLVNPYRAS